ncbi:hypothetical protein EG68_12486 [Paragonimus skrjabini miyazakii]|uniref:Uncharacterized protein n=1 Tax=Paragonimus skrjabini miyazakii TaxID=59628 RepID=A0A8S9Y8E6_9TREM|nr:hypothetical protein EG68_12486 [Paragonimus skrjabini miyazakii]
MEFSIHFCLISRDRVNNILHCFTYCRSIVLPYLVDALTYALVFLILFAICFTFSLVVAVQSRRKSLPVLTILNYCVRLNYFVC